MEKFDNREREFNEQRSALDRRADKLFERYNDLPGDTHARHVVGQIIGAARSWLEAAKATFQRQQVCEFEYLRKARDALDLATLWFELLDSFPEFQKKELQGMDGAFPELSISDSQGYVRIASERLRKK